MQWSYEQLSLPEQRMLRQVSVFAGGWTLQAAADVAQITDEYGALALLTQLHDKSLLAVDREVAGGRPRYRMLETVRQYALDRLSESGEGPAARSRHLAHFIDMAEAAEPHVRGPDQDVWMRRFKQEQENLVVALTWCCESTVDPQQGLRLAAATGYYWGWNSVELGHRLARATLDHDAAALSTPADRGRCGSWRGSACSSDATKRRLSSPNRRWCLLVRSARRALWPGRSTQWAWRWKPWTAANPLCRPFRKHSRWRAISPNPSSP